ncbi:MAG: glycosyltransferase family 9 protein, partial [Candidatus Cloacimonetes bacterium]|nr:glycosyltransferase family 9 protein [Candidatus Cloacimonadota bacterium]
INDYSFKFDYLNDYRVEFLGFNKKSFLINYSKEHLVQRGNPVLKFLDLEKINLLPEKEFQPNNSDYIAIHAGADFIGRRWPVENFKSIIKFLLMEFKDSIKQVYLLGGNQDYQINEQISENIQHCINIAGKRTLKEVCYLIQGARYFIGNDSGPLHMAAFLGIPVIGFYGPNLPEISGPYTEKRKVFFKKFDCNPCNQKSCNINYQCIKSNSVKEVTEFLEELEN